MEPVSAVTPEIVSTPESPVTPTPEPTAAEPIAPAAPAPAPVLDTPEQVEAARQTRFQRRIDELTRQRHDALREAEYWKSQATPTAPTPGASAPVSAGEPRSEQFDTTEAYLKALVQHEVRTSREADTQAAAARKREEDAASLAAAFAPQLAKARAKYDDFDEVVNAPLFSPQTQELLLTSPHGAEIGYYLGKHPEEADALNRLSGVAAARSVVLLEQKMTSATGRQLSSAPPPITPVTGTASGVKDPEKMTTEEWMAWERQQRIERLKTAPL